MFGNAKMSYCSEHPYVPRQLRVLSASVSFMFSSPTTNYLKVHLTVMTHHHLVRVRYTSENPSIHLSHAFILLLPQVFFLFNSVCVPLGRWHLQVRASLLEALTRVPLVLPIGVSATFIFSSTPNSLQQSLLLQLKSLSALLGIVQDFTVLL